jgi:hypothetical protein
MGRYRWLMLLVLAALPLAGCSKGDECDTCEQDSDCREGLVCRNFLDDEGTVIDKRCASGLGRTQCRVR